MPTEERFERFVHKQNAKRISCVYDVEAARDERGCGSAVAGFS